MGTPDFAVPSLEILLKNSYNVVAVITAPDKPAGRGLQLQQSAVKKAALELNIPILQPVNLKDENFLEALSQYKANLQIVVAFRMLPNVVWQMPAQGTFNLHASLLPQYRGAAPINWAIMNGEKQSGVSTFFLQQEIDTGKIIHRAVCDIGDHETAGMLHDKLMQTGADLVLRTVEDIFNGSIMAQDQSSYFPENGVLKAAPKIHKLDCKIDWSQSAVDCVNKVRGLYPFPAAFAEFTDDEARISVKLFSCEARHEQHDEPKGKLISDGKTYIKVSVKDGYVFIHRLQLAGKKPLNTKEFLRGYQFTGDWRSI